MKQLIRRTTLALALLALVVGVAPVSAQISKANKYFTPSGDRVAGTDAVAFDSVNQVYLVSHVSSGSEAWAWFFDKSGTQIGSMFNIVPSGEAAYVGWFGCAFGGSTSDPVFIFTYIAQVGSTSYVKRARMVRYREGNTPLVGSPIDIINTQGVWYAGEKAMAVWQGNFFIVGTLIPAGTNQAPILHAVSPSGSVLNSQALGDGMDNYGNPQIACSFEDRQCLVSGWAQGSPFGGAGGSYIRMINADTLQPLKPTMGYVDEHTARAEDQCVVFNVYTKQFLTLWQSGRSGAWLDHRLVNLDSTLVPPAAPDYSTSIGPGAGDNRMAFNPTTRTTLLITKYAPPGTEFHADMYTMELDDSGAMIRPSNALMLTPWDNTTPIYNGGMAADRINARWLVALWFSPGTVYLVQGTAGINFTKVSPTPGSYGLTSPVTLSWQPLGGASGYEYCISTTQSCTGSWTSSGTGTSVSPTLSDGTYYWQVRATLNGQTGEADGGVWWSFTVGQPPFNKIAPTNGTVTSGNEVTLAWTSIPGGTYRVCLDTSNNGWCDTGWVSLGSSTSVVVAGLSPGLYFWQAQAVTSKTTNADSGTWWSFVVPMAAGQGIINAAGSWLFADGAQGLSAGFKTYYLISNPNATQVHVRGWVLKEGTSAINLYESTIPAHSRQTVDLGSIIGASVTGSYSAVFQSVAYDPDGIPGGLPVYVGRSMFWGSPGGVLTGAGHMKTGTYIPSGGPLPTVWYFAEGARVMSPSGQFETYFKVLNPTQSPANVQVDFVSDNGTGILKSVTQTVAAQSMWTVSASSYPELNYRSFSTTITSTNGIGIAAERAMYWGSNWSGGHAGSGTPSTSPDWYFAEGAAMVNFETYYTIVNPTASTVTATATYLLSPVNGNPQSPVTKIYNLGPNSRTTVRLFDEVGNQPGVASEFHANGYILVERSEYWGSTWNDGSSVSGASAPAYEWHLPDGTTLPGFETYVCLSNPNYSATTVDVTTFSDTGQQETHTVTVPAKSRLTLWMNNQNAANGPVWATIPANAFSVRATSSGGAPLRIVVEEAIYWNPLPGIGQYWRGGDAAMGFPIR